MAAELRGSPYAEPVVEGQKGGCIIGKKKGQTRGKGTANTLFWVGAIKKKGGGGGKNYANSSSKKGGKKTVRDRYCTGSGHQGVQRVELERKNKLRVNRWGKAGRSHHNSVKGKKQSKISQ